MAAKRAKKKPADFDPAITLLGAKCLEALVAAHPQLRAFDLQVQTIRM